MDRDERVMIVPGADVMQDMGFAKWPFPGVDPETAFVATPTGPGRVKCIAPGFGGNPYGNGAVYVNISDCVPAGKRPELDRSERVLAELRVGPLHAWATTDTALDEIATILRREFAAVERETFEEAAEICDARAEAFKEVAIRTDSPGASSIAQARMLQAQEDAVALRARAKEIA